MNRLLPVAFAGIFLIFSAFYPSSGGAQKAVEIYHKPGETFQDCPECPVMVVIPSGRFMMGLTTAEQDWLFATATSEVDLLIKLDTLVWAKPRHSGLIGSAFAVGTTEVTRGQFRSFVDATGYDAGNKCGKAQNEGTSDEHYRYFTGINWRSPGFEQTDDHPVVCVGWYDAKAYVAWLSRLTGHDYRLPSEAEWEYIARAGTETVRYWGDDFENEEGCLYGNVRDEQYWGVYGDDIFTCRDGFKYTAPVGRYRANGFGVHDILGNVWETVGDCWNHNYDGAPRDGSVETRGTCDVHILRGGGSKSTPHSIRAAMRGRATFHNRGDDQGFRVAMTFSR